MKSRALFSNYVKYRRESFLGAKQKQRLIQNAQKYGGKYMVWKYIDLGRPTEETTLLKSYMEF